MCWGHDSNYSMMFKELQKGGRRCGYRYIILDESLFAVTT